VEKLIDQSNKISIERKRMGIWFGVAAGLIFSIFLWGSDAVILARSNAYLPWAKLLLGVIPAVGIFTLVSWLSVKFDHGLLTFIFWLLGGFAVCYFACRLPFDGLNLFYKVTAPELAARIDYTFVRGLGAHTFITMVICSVASALAGVLFGLLSQNAASSASAGGVVINLLVWSLFFIAATTVIDIEIQQRLRDPLKTLNVLVEKKIDSETTPVTREEARRIHLYSLNTISDLVDNPRKLILAGYDSTLIQTDVLVNFNGNWAECIVIADQSADPPVQNVIYCRPIK
jgi:hypothetical protein